MLQKYIEKSGNLKDKGGNKPYDNVSRTALGNGNSCFGNIQSVTFYIDDPALRPSLCSVFVCVPISLCGVIALGLYGVYGGTLCIVGLVLLIGGLISTAVSLACYVTKRNQAVQIETEKLEQKRMSTAVINPNMDKVEDPIMARSIVLPQYRACEEAWAGSSPPQSGSHTKSVRFYTPLRRDHMISHSEQIR